LIATLVRCRKQVAQAQRCCRDQPIGRDNPKPSELI
jgi:hypothetical protein